MSEKSQLNKILSDLKKMSKELSILKYSKFLGRDAVSFGKKIDLSLNKIVQEFNKINDLKNSNITRKKFFIFKSKLFHPFKVYQNYLYHRSNKDQPSVVKQSNKVEPDSGKINAPLCGVLGPAPRGLSAKLRGKKSKAKDINSLVYTS